MSERGKSYIYCSFFKERKIDYRYVEENDEILFPCTDCGGERHLNVLTSYWYCEKCNSKGSFFDLIEPENENDKKQRIYNPHRERRYILDTLGKFIKKHPSRELENVRKRIDDLISYLEKTTPTKQ